MLNWQKVYLTQMKDMVERGAIQPDRGRQVAKGLKYTIKALEGSVADYKSERRKSKEDAYKEASEYFE
jgi:hypothetical protein